MKSVEQGLIFKGVNYLRKQGLNCNENNIKTVFKKEFTSYLETLKVQYPILEDDIINLINKL